MKVGLFLVTAFLLWPGCSSENEITCNPPRISNGTFRPQRAIYHDGDLIRIQCDSGFTFEPDNGGKVVECTNNGWSPSPKCVKITCNPPRISNGTFRPQRTIYHDGDLIQIQCDSGFTFEPDNGEKVVECTKNGWSPSPKCVNIEGGCGRPPAVDNGDIVETLKETYVQSESVTYQCQSGYILKGSARVTCQNGHWSKAPTCAGKGCDYVLIENGRMAGRYIFPIREGQTIQFYCNRGFLPANKQTWQTATCINSRYDPEPKCFNVTCPAPPPVENAEIVEDTVKKYMNGEKINYRCIDGFEISGSAAVTCRQNNWSRLPRCVDIRCSSPPEIPNGQITSEIKAKYLPREKVYYRCHAGYSLLGTPFTTCLKKHWTQTPHCTDLGGKCGRPPVVENGDIVDTPKETYLPSENVTYQCQNFYTMEGSARVTCQNGRWSQTPTCRVPCTVTEEDMREHNIRLKWSNQNKIYFEDGNIVEFECLSGYKPHPDTGSFRVSCVDGKFDYPDCIPI